MNTCEADYVRAGQGFDEKKALVELGIIPLPITVHPRPEPGELAPIFEAIARSWEDAAPRPLPANSVPPFTTNPVDYLRACRGVVVSRSDEELVAQFLEGDHQSFNEIVAKHFRRMWWVARRYTNTVDDAVDVFQEAMLKAFSTLHTFRGESSLSTWLHRVVVNTAHDSYLKRARHENMVALEDAEGECNWEVQKVLQHNPLPGSRSA